MFTIRAFISPRPMTKNTEWLLLIIFLLYCCQCFIFNINLPFFTLRSFSFNFELYLCYFDRSLSKCKQFPHGKRLWLITYLKLSGKLYKSFDVKKKRKILFKSSTWRVNTQTDNNKLYKFVNKLPLLSVAPF